MEKPYISLADIKEEPVIKIEVIRETVAGDILQNIDIASEFSRLPKEVKFEYSGNTLTLCAPDVSYVSQELELKGETFDDHIVDEPEKEESFMIGNGDEDCSIKCVENADAKKQKADKSKAKGNKKQTISSGKEKYTNFQCYNCGYKTSDKSNLTRHIRTHLKIKRFKCPFCNKGYSEKRDMDTHTFRYHHNKTKELKETLISSKIYKCDHCEYQSFNCGNLKKHNRRHSKIKPFKCQFCNKSYSDKRSLNAHNIKYHHNLISCNIHNCAQCEYQSFSPLKGHMESRDASIDVESLKCYSCDYETKCKKYLRNHINKMHSNIQRKYHQCEHCDSKFVKKLSLASHILRNHKDIMDKAQASWVMHCKIFVCPNCPFECVTSTYMKDHMITHGVINNRPKHKCQTCGYETYFKSRLNKHVRLHGGIRPFSCLKCKKDFNEKCEMEAHILSNHATDKDLVATVKRKIYKCDICDYKSLLPSRLKQHMSKSPATCEKFKKF